VEKEGVDNYGRLFGKFCDIDGYLLAGQYDYGAHILQHEYLDIQFLYLIVEFLQWNHPVEPGTFGVGIRVKLANARFRN
jgi:hypothetical protein